MATLGLWWWIDRWRKSTAFTDMTLEEQGAYRNLLDEATLRGGALPDNERILAKACGDALRWKHVRAAVLARFPLGDDGMRRNETLDEVLYQGERRRRNQQNYRDRKGAHAADNAAGHVVAHVTTHDAGNKAAYPDPDPDQEPEEQQQQQPSRTVSRAKEPIPFADFVPLPPEFLTERLHAGTRDNLIDWCMAVREAFVGFPVNRSRPWDFWKARWAEATEELTPTPKERAAWAQWSAVYGHREGLKHITLEDYLQRSRRGQSLTDTAPIAPRFAHFVTEKDRTP